MADEPSIRRIVVEKLEEPFDPALVEEVVDRLHRGEVVVLPTDTLYALVAAVESSKGLTHIFEIKQRDDANPLPVFAADLSQARMAARFGPEAERLAEVFWPGQLTLVLPRRPNVGWDLGGDPSTIGIRIPDSNFVREVCRGAGLVTGTSANVSGEPPPADVEQAMAALGDKVNMYVDGGPSPKGVPSTVISLVEGFRVLREGAVSVAEIRRVIG